MMFITHACFSLFLGLIAIRWLAFPVEQHFFLAIVVFASLLTDIDSAHSFLGSKVKALSFAFSHRGVVHSLLFMVALSAGFFLLMPNIYYLSGFVIGYSSHLLLDSLNPKGVALLWPAKKRMKGIFRTTGLVDWVLLLFFFIFDVLILTQ